MQVASTKLNIFMTTFSLFILVNTAIHAKDTIGWVEHVTVHPGDLKLKAKIDSGAQTSSIHCICQRIVDRNGEKWVNFTVTNFKDEQVTLERKIVRMATIKRHFGKAQERPVIKLGVCMGNKYKEIEVNIVDRSGLNYQMLVGRNYLAGDFLIDSAATFTVEPDCTAYPED
ncbi:MAG: RimK/LysX family protein [Thioalkalispiraceae bacterium]